jgi:dienelactone hydrolase
MQNGMETQQFHTSQNQAPPPATPMKNYSILYTLIIFLIALGIGFFSRNLLTNFDFFSNSDLMSPLSIVKKTDQIQPKPLQKYAITELATQDFLAETGLSINKKLSHNQTDSTPYQFTYQTQGKTISGQVNLPDSPRPATGYPVIVMLRGYAPPESYYTGFGTKNAAAVYARNGYMTIAPDFLGFGESDKDFENTWEGRFVKPANVIDLLTTIKTFPTIKFDDQAVDINPNKIGLWGHSNGGQIALTTLEVLAEPIPTTLWAPVTAPFPYSILFFGNDLADEGKSQRAWIALLESNYDVFDFSATQHIDRLTGPIQLHHGSADKAALQSWSNLFVDKIETENETRQEAEENTATLSAQQIKDQNIELKNQIEINYLKYPGANHNMQPVWNTVVKRDLEFFEKHLL